MEFEQETGTFIIPNASTVSDLLEEYMSIYGVNTWAMSTYEARRSLIFNYISPLIGDMKLEDVTPRTMDKYYQSLLTVKAKVVNNRKPTHEYLTAHTVREIHKLPPAPYAFLLRRWWQRFPTSAFLHRFHPYRCRLRNNGSFSLRLMPCLFTPLHCAVEPSVKAALYNSDAVAHADALE